MGQLKVILEPSLLTNLVCIGVLLSSVNVIARTETDPEPNCTFDIVTHVNTSTLWTIVGAPISEKTTPDHVIWDVQTTNIKSSISSYHPHTKYLTGHRYLAHYVYKASGVFLDFVEKEKSTEIFRDVKFTCENNVELEVHFRFPLIDVNEPPEFKEVPNKELKVKIGSTDIINEDDPIVVYDKDFNSHFNSLVFTTDRPEILIISSEESPNGVGKKFRLDLKLNPTLGNDAAGRYNLNLFASDGQFTTSTPLRLLINPVKAVDTSIL